MNGINTVHALTVLSTIAVLYAVWMVYFLMRESRRSDRPPPKGNAPPQDSKRMKGDIVGKSRFVLESRRHSKPFHAIATETGKGNDNPTIFAAEEVPEHPRQIAPEELDEVFGDVPEGETNEPLDIDVPLEKEPFPVEEAEETEPDFEDETEDLPLVGRSLAQGGSFDELGDAYRRVVHNPTITEEEKEDTGRILLDLEGTDMLRAIVSGKPDREDKVTYLINTYLTAFDRRMAERSAEGQSPQGTIPDGFDVRQFL